MNKKHSLLIAGMVTLGTAGTHTFFHGFNLLFTLLTVGVAVLAIFFVSSIHGLGRKKPSDARSKNKAPQ